MHQHIVAIKTTTHFKIIYYVDGTREIEYCIRKNEKKDVFPTKTTQGKVNGKVYIYNK